jgi:hypothetical protein
VNVEPAWQTEPFPPYDERNIFLEYRNFGELSSVENFREEDQYGYDGVQIREQAYEESEIVLGEAELKDLDAVEWTSKESLGDHHYAFRIKMSNGEQWVFDPTSSEYGHKQSLVPMTNYLIQMMATPDAEAVTSRPLGSAKAKIEESLSWNNLRELGRLITDGGDFGQQEVRRCLQWGEMDDVIEKSLSKILGLEKDLKKAKAKEQKEREEKERAENNGEVIHKLDREPTTSLAALKTVNFASLFRFNKNSKDGFVVRTKQLMRASDSKFKFLNQAVLDQIGELISQGRDTIYAPNACQLRDARVKMWGIYQSAHRRSNNPNPGFSAEFRNECNATIEDILKEYEERKQRILKRCQEIAELLQLGGLRVDDVATNVDAQLDEDDELGWDSRSEDSWEDPGMGEGLETIFEEAEDSESLEDLEENMERVGAEARRLSTIMATPEGYHTL